MRRLSRIGESAGSGAGDPQGRSGRPCRASAGRASVRVLATDGGRCGAADLRLGLGRDVPARDGIRLCPVLAVVTFLVLMPLDYLWFALLGRLSM
jgi:hypothetical protein